MIGWGRDRYVERLRALREGREADLASLKRGRAGEAGEEAEGAAGGISRGGRGDRKTSRPAIGRILGMHPAAGRRRDSTISGLLCEAFARLVREYAPDRLRPDAKPARPCSTGWTSSSRRAGSRPCRSRRPSTSSAPPGASLRVGASPPMPGRLHVAGLRREGIQRQAGHVRRSASTRRPSPAAAFRTPFCSTKSATAISDFPADLGRRPPRPSLRIGRRSRLPSRPGRASSYPSYDVVEGRESFPSSVVLQAFRLLRGDADLDYGALERSLAGASGSCPAAPSRAFDEADWWLERLRPSRGPTVPDGLRPISPTWPPASRPWTPGTARR